VLLHICSFSLGPLLISDPMIYPVCLSLRPGIFPLFLLSPIIDLIS
jgi:hypothetical protein